MKRAVCAGGAGHCAAAFCLPAQQGVKMPMKCISVMTLLTVQQLQALGGNSLQKPVTVKCFFVSEERRRELVRGGPEAGGVSETQPFV